MKHDDVSHWGNALAASPKTKQIAVINLVMIEYLHDRVGRWKKHHRCVWVRILMI